LAINITEDKRAEIRHRADIVEIISERIVLKKAGKDFVGLCPFHSEKTPSFTVSPGKQIYHCFGCGAGGDVFSFMMKYDGVGFSEAVSEIARRYGIDLPTRSMTPQQKKNISEKQLLFDINHQVMNYYRTQLADRLIGETAREYLQQRGFNRKVIDEFELGFAPEGWDKLIHFIRKSNIPLSIAEKTGLIIPKENKGYYDRFRNRIIFPILDEKRRVIGFGGRVLDDSKPKYLNSPESPIYHKGHSLYGVHASKDRCRETETVFIVEGYFDLISLHQHGFTNSVATLGTALTVEHVRLLKRGFARKAYLVFDSDAAGVKAAHRSIPIFMDESVSAAVVVLPKGYDPDSYLHKMGAKAFQEATDHALGMIDFLIESAVLQYGLTIEGKLRILSEISDPLSRISDSVTRSIYIRHVADRINVEEAAVAEKIRSVVSRIRQVKHHQDNRAQNPPKTESISRSCSSPTTSDDLRLEKQIVSMMLKYPKILPQVEKSGAMNYFQDKDLKNLGQMIFTRTSHDENEFSDLMNQLEDDVLRQLLASLAISDECWDQKSCENLLFQFIQSQKRKRQPLISRIKAAEESNDQELLLQLLKEKQEQAVTR
jgi:DNA primase